MVGAVVADGGIGVGLGIADAVRVGTVLAVTVGAVVFVLIAVLVILRVTVLLGVVDIVGTMVNVAVLGGVFEAIVVASIVAVFVLTIEFGEGVFFGFVGLGFGGTMTLVSVLIIING